MYRFIGLQKWIRKGVKSNERIKVFTVEIKYVNSGDMFCGDIS